MNPNRSGPSRAERSLSITLPIIPNSQTNWRGGRGKSGACFTKKAGAGSTTR